MNNTGLTEQEAQWQVMAEFLSFFPKPKEPQWHPALVCDGHTAEDRVKYLEANDGMSNDAAQKKVMAEFPDVFKAWEQKWNDGTLCTHEGESHTAHARAKWLVDNRGEVGKGGVTLGTAKELVMMEFPWNFLTNKHLPDSL